jgi:signal transduction histidine kinase
MQTLGLMALVIQLLRRRRAERSLRESENRLKGILETVRDFGGRLIQAQEEERARLGRELHDDVTQRLASLAIDIGRIELDGACKTVNSTLGDLREKLVRLSEDVHELSYRLHPSLWNDLGLVAALQSEADRMSRSTSCRVKVSASDVGAVPAPVALCLYRIAQEALRNIERHARARTAEVTVRPLEEGWQLAVHGDGVGFDPTLPRSRHSLGLASMNEPRVGSSTAPRFDA